MSTEQEDAIYTALKEGDSDSIEQMREEAYTADQTSPEWPPPEGWLPPRQQFDLDYQNAWIHYQADNEDPEEEREANTVTKTEEENADAPDPEPEPGTELEPAIQEGEVVE